MKLVLEGILFVLGEGCSWRAINRPEASWNSVYQYYRRWCRSGLWNRLLDKVSADPAGTLRFLDSTHVKVHCDGANPEGGQENQAMGRSRGGLNTKIHAVVDNHAAPVSIMLSGANRSDVTLASAMLAGQRGIVVVADKAYDCDSLCEEIIGESNRTCIPPRSGRLHPRTYSAHNYKKRHRVENFFQKLKRYRRVATRYDKLAETFLGFVCLAVIAITV
jgi:transposase